MAALPLVRRRVRGLLESSPSFRALPADERRRIADDTVRVAACIADPGGLVSAEFRSPLLLVKPARPPAVRTVRLDMTLGGGSAALDALVSDLDFPDFVAALIHGVFHAIVDASIRQMEAYAALVASVAESLAAFASDSISDQDARDWLTEEFPDVFCAKGATARLAWRADVGPAARSRLQAALGTKGKLEPDLRRVVAATRRRLARNRQQTLATVVLMGINRIVVSDGKVVPKIRFVPARR